MLKPVSIFMLFSVGYILQSCTSNEIGNAKDVNPDAVFFDYKIWGDETKDITTCMLQYRFAGPNGTTLVLEDPSKVEIDGHLLNVDSSKMSGAYYEWVNPVDSFAGKHTIIFSDMNGKKYSEDFRFSPFKMLTIVPAEFKRNDLVLDLSGLDSIDYVRVSLIDTAYDNNDISRIDTLKNGHLVISKSQLDSLVNGPIQMEIIKEENRPVKNSTREGGNITVTYGLKREFVLKN
jgi:hypothetical protein